MPPLPPTGCALDARITAPLTRRQWLRLLLADWHAGFALFAITGLLAAVWIATP